MAGGPKLTPAIRQHRAFKERFPGCVLFFRMGDFYELFGEDAERVSAAIGLTLTARGGGEPMAGVPHQRLDHYLGLAVEAGFRVAVCDQVQDPKDAKGVVARAVTRVVTPGTLTEETLLPEDTSRTLGAVRAQGESFALASIDLSTGRFLVESVDRGSVHDALQRLAVGELLVGVDGDGAIPDEIGACAGAAGAATTGVPSWHFDPDEARRVLCEQFGVSRLDAFGLTDDDPMLGPAGAAVRYLRETQGAGEAAVEGLREGEFAEIPRSTLDHLLPPKRPAATQRCAVDTTSLRALEVERTIRSAETRGSLLGVFLHAGAASPRTAMGRRRVREWLCAPLGTIEAIERRQHAVRQLIDDEALDTHLGEQLDGVQDAARIAARVALGRCSPRDLVALGVSLSRCDALLTVLEGAEAFVGHHARLAEIQRTVAPLAQRVIEQCVDEPPAHLREGGLIRDGVDEALDEARTLMRDAGAWLAAYQQKASEQYDLPGLKAGFNKVFGYYLELPSGQAARAPTEFIRKQTLKNAERYITPDLKDFEDRALNAEGTAVSRERELFEELLSEAHAEVRSIIAYADVLGDLDALLCFARKARARAWVAPELSEDRVTRIVAGRHPVLDELLEGSFVPNDTGLGGDAPPLALITGPNMAGKSTYIRQVALLTLLTHTGSFVPAESAVVGLTDRIFTRVGADDALHRGQSTFMVEMTETAHILHHATERSLVILDEIGRGTSTLDGLSLAWAICESLIDPEATGSPRALFATHYHELTTIAETSPERVGNLHVEVREWTSASGDPEIVFVHRISPGRADQSYGVHVARLAGIPSGVTTRASELLTELSVEQRGVSPTPPTPRPAPSEPTLFDTPAPHPAVDALKEIKLESMTPLEAFDRLRDLHKLASND
ncbi:MAG: DNA mismatch repair protein MutS [Planctomycetota bacterium]